MMSTEELNAALVMHLAEEKEDSKRYCNLAKEAKAHGWHGVAGVLQDMAHDEESHIRVLMNILHIEED